MAIGINGLGRIGRLTLRAAMGGVARDAADPASGNRLEIAHVNEIAGGVATAAHLLEFDSVQGRWRADITTDGESALTIDGHRMGFSTAADPGDVAWGDLGCDVVLECTGRFRTVDSLRPYFERGVKRVIVAAPVKDGSVLNVVMGVNDQLYDRASHPIVTAASCTTNCLAPVVKVVHETFGIEHGMITTIHDITNTQVPIDAFKSDLRRARSGLTSLIPTTTGSAKAIAMIFPELKGKLNGHAVRVPLLNGSLTDAVFELKQSVTVEQVNDAFKAASEGALKGILGYEERPLVSCDYTNDNRSSIIDALSTMVVDDNQLKVFAWYDNEWGYSCRMADLTCHVVGLDA